MSRPLELLAAASPYLPRWVSEAARSDRGFEAARQLEASVLVCDLAGFTDTTRRLTEKGAAGPEESLELLNEWYRAVLEPVTDAEGDIVAFAGDSFTALFEGPSPRRRLALATSVARRILSGHPAGARMGLADGPVTLGVVGSPTARHPVILGPTARAAARAMQAARIDSLFWITPEGPRELEARIDPEADPTDPTDPAIPTANSVASLVGGARQIVERLRPFLPTSVWEGLLHPRAAGQHRPAVVLFARVGLATGPLLSFEELEQTLSRAALLVERVGGHVQKIDATDKGVVLLAFFGIPTVTQNPTARAAEVALGLREELGLGVALTSGRVFAGDLGSPLRHEFSAVGDPINRAARILQATPPGEAHCDQALAGELTFVSSTDLPPLEARGFTRPIPVSRLGDGVSGEFAAYLEERSPLLGREAELDRILDHCRRQARNPGVGHDPGALIVTGELGIGKSRLVREAARRLRAEGFRIAFGHFGRYRAFQTLSELGEALGFEATSDRRQILERLGGAFSEGPGKVLIFIEDLHLAGDDDLRLIREALPSLLATGGTLLCTTRPGSEYSGLGERIELGRLEQTSALALVRHHAPRLPLGEAETITRRGGGNPLFLEELARSAADGIEAVPATVEDAIRERLESLDPLSRKLLDFASVASPVFDFSAFDAVVSEEGKGEVREALRRLLAEGVLRPGPGKTYRFAHDLERTVVHDTLSFAERRSLHQQALAALEERGEALAAEAYEHLEALGEREQAGRAALAAAREAAMVRADWELVRLARNAIGRLQATAEILEAEGLLARGLQFVADWRASNELAERLEGEAERLGLSELQMRMAIVLAGNWSFLADYTASEEALTRALALGVMPVDVAPHVDLIRGWNAWGRGLYPEARRYLERAREVAPSGSTMVQSITSSLVSVLILLGEFAAATRALPDPRDKQSQNTYFYLFDHMDLSARRGDIPLLRDLLRESEILQRTNPAGSRIIHELEVIRAYLRELEGRWEDAAAARDFAITTNREIEAHYELLDLLMENAIEALLSGQYPAVLERSRHLGDLAEALEAGDQSARAQVLGATAELLSGEVRRDLSDLVYRNRRFASRSSRWDLTLAVEILAALLEEAPEDRRRALAALCEDCHQREDRRGERTLRLLAWRHAQVGGEKLEAERRWVALTERLDAWGTPRWTFGTRLTDLPEDLPRLGPAKEERA